MKVLGIKYGGHDTSAALMIDGKLIAACAQERYTHDKHSRLFPNDAARDCLKIGNISINQVDEVAFVNDIKTFIREIYLKPAINDDVRLDFLYKDIDKLLKLYNSEKIIRENLNYKGKINFYRHHLCHVASSYYPSGFKEALCFSIDGMAESETGIIASAKPGLIKVLHDKNVYPHSLGLLYSAITDFLGWKHHCDEGIIMGLAPYGNAMAKIPNSNETYISVFEEILKDIGDFRYTINLELVDYYTGRDKWVTEKFKKIFGRRRIYDEPILDHHKNIAAALQLRLEQIILGQLRLAKETYGFSKLCLSGGVALNCSMNGKIEQSRLFDEIFVQPASGDDGCAIGACYLASAKSKDVSKISKKMHNSYLGSRFSMKAIEDTLLKSKLKFNKPKNIHKTIAKKLEEGKIVGWFQNASEFGPRALGNRSILCRPYPKEMKDHLNKQVKFREEFRPFAPSVLDKFQKDYFNINQDSPHMLIATHVKKEKKNIIPAVVHIDDTCRVQTVKKEINESFYLLLEAFYELTKIPVILNTSFNVKGQPMINTPAEAINTFKNTKIDVLAVGDFVIEK